MKINWEKFLVIFVIICGLLVPQSALFGQEMTNKVVDLTWQTDNAEPDVQYYQIYSGDSDTTLVKFGDPIPFNPNDPAAPTSMTFNYDLTVPADSVVTKWFSVTAIDTSGNESLLATPVSVTIDNEAPSAPTGLTISIRVVTQ
jgi:hypothetical protein